MAFGKRSSISDNLNDYSIMLCGESGIGKTTVIARMCEMEFGEDGYLLLNTGDEEGVSAIDDVTYEDAPTYKKFAQIVDDIIKNKKDEYPNLKVVIIDTLDQLIEATEAKAIDDWNRANIGQKNFKPAKSLNAVEGGFGAGYDVVFNMIYEKVRLLNKVGVKVWYCCHSKSKDVVDPLTSAAYTTLTSNMPQRYFNDFKTKVHVVGVACIDRTINAVGTGRQNIINHKEITVNKIQEETRQIVFRDDSYSVDSKSRFAGIVDRIPLDPEELRKALKDAIKNSKTSSKHTKPSVSVKVDNVKLITDVKEEIDEELNAEEIPFDENELDEIDSDYPDNLEEVIRKMFKECKDKELKAEVKAMIAKHGKLNDCSTEALKEIYDKLN